MPICCLTPRANLAVMFDAEAIALGIEGMWSAPIQRRLFEQHYAQCASVGFEIDGVAVGGAIYDGEHFHIAVLPAYYGRWGRLWKPTLDWLFSVADPVEARIAKDNVRCLQFAERSGYPCVAEDDEFVTYRMSA